MPRFPSALQLTALNGTNGFRIDGVSAGDHSGRAVAAAGDINGDGLADVIVGAYRAGAGDSYSGEAYVVFGKASGLPAVFKLSALNGKNGFKIAGADPDDLLGGAVASAGDVNGDGLADLIVGSTGADPGGPGSNAGSSYVVFGTRAGFSPTLAVSDLNGRNGFRIDGVYLDANGNRDYYDGSGRSVAAAGDVNGDLIGDMIIGADRADENGNWSGSSYVVFGTRGGFASAVDLSALNGNNGFRLDGSTGIVGKYQYYDSAGYSVSSAGDINGDGFADVLVGTHRARPNLLLGSGASYVVFGGKGRFPSAIDLSSLDGSNGFRLEGAFAQDYTGHSVSKAGDVNGDGVGDLIIGAYRSDPNEESSGSSYVVFGKQGGFGSAINLGQLVGSNGFKIHGVTRLDRSGSSVASAGDVNGDGIDDLIIGAYLANPLTKTGGPDPGREEAGVSYVVYGRSGGFGAELQLSTLDGRQGFRIEGAAEGDFSGRSVSSAGDMNGDGFGDLIVGAFGADREGSLSGSSYVIYGLRPDAAVTHTGSDLAQTLAGGDFADTLSALAGGDKLYGHGGGDNLDGGIGNDALSGGSGRDLLQGGGGKDKVQSGADDDVVLGGDGSDLVGGDSGNDVMAGESGADRIFGGLGNDLINGGSGRDQLWGQAGADTFAFTGTTWGGDTINDFADTLDLLRFKLAIADSVADFRIAGNGTTEVTVSIGIESIVLKGAAPITLTASDFQFLA